ncbi:MAG: tetratricopeptide repeat protein [Spirochaetaceae bacterium]
MKYTRGLLCLLLLFLGSGILYAQNYYLLFLDGNAEIREKGKWHSLEIGDTAPAESTIRLSDGAIAEFDGDGDTVVFSSPGTYSLSTSASRPAKKQSSTASSIFSRLSKAGGEASEGKSEVMGVRGSEAVQAEEFTWMDEDSAYFEEAIEAFSMRDYSLALEILEHDVDPIVLDDQGSYWYYLAASYDSLGRRGPALKIVRNHKTENYSSVHNDYLFLRGRLYFESGSYKEAADAFGAFLENERDPAKKQLAYYILGLARKELGETGAGTDALREAININADAEITELARQSNR